MLTAATAAATSRAPGELAGWLLGLGAAFAAGGIGTWLGFTLGRAGYR